MLERRLIKEHLERSVCYKCGSSLEQAKLLTISDAPMAFLAHAVCPKCHGQSMVTVTTQGSGTIPLVSDLLGEEIKKFMMENSVSYDELLSLHRALEKNSIWKLLLKKDKKTVKKPKA